MRMWRLLIILACFAPLPVLAQDVVIIGEVHDNPAHHRLQAEKVAELAPKAIVFEMLTAAQAGRVTAANRGEQAALAEALEWEEGGWPDFAMYYPIFAAAPGARIYGAHVPRDAARRVMAKGAAAGWGENAARFGLDKPLAASEQTAREALQMRAHCDALPPEMLPAMVEVQRYRDARLAAQTLKALGEAGRPVVVITGNGHARRDWGVPRYLLAADPDLDIHVIGQTEDAKPLEGGFDAEISAPAPERPDPCAAFE